jgi:serine/threonine protein kinase
MNTTLVDVPVGYRAGGWEITTRIASGSWASVYAARRIQPPSSPDDPPQDLDGALKFVAGSTLSPAQRADLQEAVSDEVRFHEQADHPRLIRTFETFVVDDPARPALHGAVVLAMERASTSLRDCFGR